MLSSSVLLSGLLASSLQPEVKCVAFCMSVTRRFNLVSGNTYSLCSRAILFPTWNIHTLVESTRDVQRFVGSDLLVNLAICCQVHGFHCVN